MQNVSRSRFYLLRLTFYMCRTSNFSRGTLQEAPKRPPRGPQEALQRSPDPQTPRNLRRCLPLGPSWGREGDTCESADPRRRRVRTDPNRGSAALASAIKYTVFYEVVWASGGRWRASWGPLWSLLGPFGNILGAAWGSSALRCWPTWGVLAPRGSQEAPKRLPRGPKRLPRGSQEAFKAHLEAFLAPSWGHLAPSWEISRDLTKKKRYGQKPPKTN